MVNNGKMVRRMDWIDVFLDGGYLFFGVTPVDSPFNMPFGTCANETPMLSLTK